MSLLKKTYDAAIFMDPDPEHDVFSVLNLSPHYSIAGQKIDFITDFASATNGRMYNPETVSSKAMSFEDREKRLSDEIEQGLPLFDAKGLYVDALVYQRVSKENNIQDYSLNVAINKTLKTAGSVISKQNKQALEMAIQNMKMPENISQNLLKPSAPKNAYN